MLALIEPKPSYLNAYLAVCKSSYNHLHSNYLLHDPKCFDLWRKTIFADYERLEQGIDLPPDYVPAKTYWITDGNSVIGVVNFRLKLNARLLDYGGNVGFFICPGRQQQGLGKQVLRLAVKQAVNLQLEPLLWSCAETNLPSLKLGAQLPFYQATSSMAWADEKYTRVHRFFCHLPDLKKWLAAQSL